MKFKYILLFLLSLLCLFGCSNKKGTEGLVFESFKEGYIVAGYEGTENNVVIPSVYNGSPVIGITGYAFKMCQSLTSIEIPSSVTKIESGVFPGCTSLESIIVAEDNATYDSRDNCNAIIETSTNELIAGCKNTIIPNSVTSIGSCAFSNCSSLENIEIPNSVTSIGYAAFFSCSNLKSIEIPNSVTMIESWVFPGCTSLESIIVAEDNATYDSRDNCNGIIETSTNELIAGCKNTIIPNSITSIGVHAFNYCSNLESINIPNSVTSIGGYAFSNCSSLENIEIPNSVTSIGERAFAYCSSLTSITIPNSVTSIGDFVFFYCSSLESVYNDSNIELNISDLNDAPNSTKIYNKGEWSYVNGVPTPNKN